MFWRKKIKLKAQDHIPEGVNTRLAFRYRPKRRWDREGYVANSAGHGDMPFGVHDDDYRQRTLRFIFGTPV
jgi:hypothetical protein